MKISYIKCQLQHRNQTSKPIVNVNQLTDPSAEKSSAEGKFQVIISGKSWREISSADTISDHVQYQDWNVKLQNEIKVTPEVNFII